MNRIKFYRYKDDGTVEVAHVKVCQPRGRALYATKPHVTQPFGEGCASVTRQVPVITYPTVAQANESMYKDGWVRTTKELKCRPTT